MLSLRGECDKGFNHVRFKYDAPYSLPLTDTMVVQINRIYSEASKSDFAISLKTGTNGVIRFQRTLQNISDTDPTPSYTVLTRLLNFNKENVRKLERVVDANTCPIIKFSDVAESDTYFRVQIELPPKSHLAIKSLNILRVLGLTKCLYDTHEFAYDEMTLGGRTEKSFISLNATDQTVFVTGELVNKEHSVMRVIENARRQREKQLREQQRESQESVEPVDLPTDLPLPEEEPAPASDEFESAEEDDVEEEEEPARPEPTGEASKPPNEGPATGQSSTAEEDDVEEPSKPTPKPARPEPPKQRMPTQAIEGPPKPARPATGQSSSTRPGIKRVATAPPPSTSVGKKPKPVSTRQRVEFDDSFLDQFDLQGSDNHANPVLSYDNIVASREYIGADHNRYRRSLEDLVDYETVDSPIITLIHVPLALQYDVELDLREGDNAADIARKLTLLVKSTNSVMQPTFKTKDDNKLIIEPPNIFSLPTTDLPGTNLQPYYILELDSDLCDLLGFGHLPITFSSEQKTPIESSPIVPIRVIDNALDSYGHFYAINDNVTLNEPSTLSYLHQLGTRQVLFSTKKHRSIPFRLSTKQSDFELVLFKDVQVPLTFSRTLKLYAELHILNYM